MKKKLLSRLIATAMLFALAVPALTTPALAASSQSEITLDGIVYMESKIFPDPIQNPNFYYYEYWVKGCLLYTSRLWGNKMDSKKNGQIACIVENEISAFTRKFRRRYEAEVDNPDGVINRKKNNAYISVLGEAFMFYSAFCRSFDSSFGKVLEKLGNKIAALSFEVRGNVDSYLLPQQSQHIDYLMSEYHRHTKPHVEDYTSFNCLHPDELASYLKSHVTDNYFYDPNTTTHVLIELKAGGDLDNKKAEAEKKALLEEYFILRNSLRLKGREREPIHLYLGTAYNKFGEGSAWKQERVQTFFAEEELLIGQDYWNFVCQDPDGFEVFFTQYQKSCEFLKETLKEIKDLYFNP